MAGKNMDEWCAEDVVQNPFGCKPGKWKFSLGFLRVNMYSHPGGGGGTNPKKILGEKSNSSHGGGFRRKRSKEALREWQEFWFTGVQQKTYWAGLNSQMQNHRAPFFWMNHVKQQWNNC